MNRIRSRAALVTFTGVVLLSLACPAAATTAPHRLQQIGAMAQTQLLFRESHGQPQRSPHGGATKFNVPENHHAAFCFLPSASPPEMPPCGAG